MQHRTRSGHLTDDELFGLALPPAGEPEALPAHLLSCTRCGRALQEWKSAVRKLAEDDVEPVMRRSAEEWRSAEDRTLAALSAAPGARRFRALPWAAGLAAVLLLLALLAPWRRSSPLPPAATATQASGLSPQDRADDALLREVAALSRGEEGGDWNVLAPESPRGDEEAL